MTSSELKYLTNAPSPNTIALGDCVVVVVVGGEKLQYLNLGQHKHAVHNRWVILNLRSPFPVCGKSVNPPNFKKM